MNLGLQTYIAADSLIAQKDGVTDVILGYVVRQWSWLTNWVDPVLFKSLWFGNRFGTVLEPFRARWEMRAIRKRFQNGPRTVPEGFQKGSRTIEAQNNSGQDTPSLSGMIWCARASSQRWRNIGLKNTLSLSAL